jgi:hypothetical protein
MSEWTGGVKAECPAVRELVGALKVAVPLLANDPKKIGTVRNDGSRHTAGLAVDIMLDSRDLAEKSVADAIIDAVVKLHAQLRWSDLIYTDWNDGRPFHFHIPGMPPFGGPNGMLKKNPTTEKLGKDHENHIHIDWWGGHPAKWPPQATATGFKAPLIAQLQRPPEWLEAYMNRSP